MGSVAQSCSTLQLFGLWSAMPMGFFRQEYWSGLPFPPPGDLPDPGLESVSPALQADSLPTGPSRKLAALMVRCNVMVSKQHIMLSCKLSTDSIFSLSGPSRPGVPTLTGTAPPELSHLYLAQHSFLVNITKLLNANEFLSREAAN